MMIFLAVLFSFLETPWASPLASSEWRRPFFEGNNMNSTINPDGSPAIRVIKPDCDWSQKYMPQTYLSCTTEFHGGDEFVEYSMILSGNGQDEQSWCFSIVDNIREECNKHGGGDIFEQACTMGKLETAEWALDRDNKPVKKFGIKFNFKLRWPWNTDDANHHCIATAVRKATCGDIANGAICRTRDYDAQDALEFDESDWGGA